VNSISLAQVYVGAAVTSISSANITDLRTLSTSPIAATISLSNVETEIFMGAY